MRHGTDDVLKRCVFVDLQDVVVPRGRFTMQTAVVDDH
jgi:hypothetical protein